MNASGENSDSQVSKDEPHRVVALRYRPQTFEALVGQDHISQALTNAIAKNRVGHAYLFTGSRGVGKTSSARIFAKCLNCLRSCSAIPCGECDVCQAVGAGDDIDVIEIDGASNRGIDEIRQLRANVAIRPSRSRFKIYIIDEVHMLTTPAFNALLKTLEEPPTHVKFIFCTTDPEKIPITVLSRCQRFDFAPVQTDEIQTQLRKIAIKEEVEIDEESLLMLARRAGGSMRDSQSLLEQVLSFCGSSVTIDQVNQLLGTADLSRIHGIAVAMVEKNPSETLGLIHTGLADGVDAGQLAEQLLAYFRDMMANHAGCGAETLLTCLEQDIDNLKILGDRLGLETILMVVQVLDAALVGMQSSLHARTLLEVAAIRICSLENLDSIPALVESLSKSGTAKPGRTVTTRPKLALKPVALTPRPNADSSKKNETTKPVTAPSPNPVSVASTSSENPTDVGNTPSNGVAADQTVRSAQSKHVETKPVESKPVETNLAQSKPAPISGPALDPGTLAPGNPNHDRVEAPIITAENVHGFWMQLIEKMDEITSDMASEFENLKLANPGHLIVTLNDSISKDVCSMPERKLKFESAMAEITGTPIRIDFVATKKSDSQPDTPVRMSRAQQIRKLQEDGFVKQTLSLFGAEITDFREPRIRPKL